MYMNIERERETEKVSVAQSCPTLGNPMDYSPPGSSVHGILQARILEWAAISFSRILCVCVDIERETERKNKAIVNLGKQYEDNK